MKISFYDDQPVFVSKDRGEALQKQLIEGVELINIDGNLYKASSIKSVTQTERRTYKTPSELGMPNLGDGLNDKQRARLIAPVLESRTSHLLQ